MVILFVTELTIVIVAFVTGDGIIKDIAHDSEKEIEKLKHYLNIVQYYCIGSLVIMLLMMMFVKCYIGSLRNRNFDFDYKFLDEDGNKLTIQEKQALDK